MNPTDEWIIQQSIDIKDVMTEIPDLADCSNDVKHKTMTEYIASLASELVNQNYGDLGTLQSDDYILAIKLAINTHVTNKGQSAQGYERILNRYEYRNAIELGFNWFELDVATQDRDYYKNRVAVFDHYCERLELNEIDKQE